MMKKIFLKWGHIFAAVALVVATGTANVTCTYHFHQEELPDQIKKMRKF